LTIFTINAQTSVKKNIFGQQHTQFIYLSLKTEISSIESTLKIEKMNLQYV